MHAMIGRLAAAAILSSGILAAAPAGAQQFTIKTSLPTINDDTLFQTAQSTLKKADRALDSMSDTGPITAVGIVANSLF